MPFFESLFSLIESEPDYRFVLDGQSILIEDYLAQLPPSEQVQAARQIATCVAEGRLVIGPYYQQPDWQLVSGEALVRNLVIGSADSYAFGGRSNAGWLLDNFGQISQCVQIHAGFGIKGLYAWRGFDLLPDHLRTEMWWESPDGSRLPVIYLIDSYRNGMRLFSESPFLSRRFASAQGRIQRFSSDDNLLLMNGYDQEMEPENTPAGIRELHARLQSEGIAATPLIVTTPDEYLQIKKSAFEKTPEMSRGAQYSGRFISVFPGILSSRVYLKIANSRAQSVLERYIEPLISILACHAPDRAASHWPELDVLWRLTLQNHPHDTICGVGSDPVHEETELRLVELERRHRIILRSLAQDLGALLQSDDTASTESSEDGTRDSAPLLFNPSAWPRHTVISGRGDIDRVVGEIPALTVVPMPDRAHEVTSAFNDIAVDLGDDSIVIDNGIVVCSVDGTGTISVGHVGSGVSIDDCVRWRDTGDAGDTYNYDRPSHDRIVESLRDVRLELIRRSSVRVSVRIEGTLQLPKALSAGRDGRSEAVEPVSVSLSLDLQTGDEFIRGKVTVINTVCDHRLQLCLRVLGSHEVATLSQFSWDTPPEEIGTLGRPDQEIPADVKALMLGAREPDPTAVFPAERAVAIGHGAAAILMAHRGLHEAERLDSETVALTIVRSVGWLARGDLSSRTGDAGPEIFTPGAQCLREITTDFALAPFASFADACGARGNRVAEEFLHPVVELPLGKEQARADLTGERLKGTNIQEGAESRTDSWFPREERISVTPSIIPSAEPAGALMLSAMKPSEDHSAIVLRVFNPGLSVTTALFPTQVARVTMAETAGEQSSPPALSWAIGAGEIATFRQELREPMPAPTPGWRGRFAATLEGRLPYHRFGVDRGWVPSTAWDWLLNQAPSGVDGAHISTVVRGATRERSYIEHMLPSERNRAKRLRRRAEHARGRSEKALSADPDMVESRTAELRATTSTLHRQALEAELSVMYTKWALARYSDTLGESEQDEFYDGLRKIALALNRARVSKRTDDYLRVLVAPIEHGDRLGGG